jgi:DNA polymerase III subunit delta'
VALETIAGQPRAVELLRRALAGGRLAHAYAFVGPPRSGRTATALAFAQALLCPTGGCGTCRACALVVARQHPDLHVIVPTPPETNPRGARALRIGAIRALQHQAALVPFQATCKVFVLDDAERMTGEAPQAFLKTLEEPPARTVIILVLPGVRALPATVLSRCQIVRFQPRGGADGGAEQDEALEALAEVRAGGAEALFLRTQTFERDRERAEGFVDACWLLCRDLLLVTCGAPARLLANPASAAALEREAAGWTVDELLRGVATCRQARQALAVNVAPRLTLEVVLARLALRAA